MAANGGTAVVYAEIDASKLSGQLSAGINGAAGSVGGVLKKVGAAVGIGLGVHALVEFGKKSVEAFDALDKAQKLLQVGLENLGQAGALSGLEDGLNKVSDETFIAKDATDAMAASILNLGHVYFQSLGAAGTQRILPDIVKGFDNISAAGGRLAARTLPALERVLFTVPEKAIPLLQKLGVITASEADQYQKLADAGETAALRQELINKVIGAYPGAAAKSATESQKLEHAMRNLEQAIGKLLIPIVKVTTAVVDWALKNPALAASIVGVVGALILWQTVLKDSFIATAIKWVIGYGAALIGLAGEEGVAAAASLALSDAITTVAAAAQAAFPILALFGAVAGDLAMKAKNDADPNLQRMAAAMDLAQKKGIPLTEALKQVDAAAKKSADGTGGAADLIKKYQSAIDAATGPTEKFGNVSRKAFHQFKQAVADSVQVAIGDVKKVGDAFALTGQQLLNQSNAAVKVARRENRDIAAIWGSDEINKAQKKALLKLPADQRDAWVHTGDAAQQQIAKNAVKLQRANRESFQQIVQGSSNAATTGGTKLGKAIDDGAIAGLLARSGALSATAAQVVKDAIAAMNAAAKTASPSKETEKTGRDLVLGLVLGLQRNERLLERAGSKLLDNLKTAISDTRDRLHNFLDKGLDEDAQRARDHLVRLHGYLQQGLDWERDIKRAERTLDHLKSRLKDFQDTVKGAFSELSDIPAALVQAWQDYQDQLKAFQEAQAAGTLEPGQVAPTAPDFGAIAAGMVAQAQQLAQDLTAAAQAGLSKTLLAQFAQQGPSAIPILEQLINNPELIAQLNAASKTINDAAQQTADALGEKYFGRAIRHATEDLENLAQGLKDLIRVLRRAGIDIGNAASAATTAAQSAQQQQGGGDFTVGGTPVKVIHFPMGTQGGGGHNPPVQTVTINVHGDADPARTAAKVRDEFIRIQRNNGSVF